MNAFRASLFSSVVFAVLMISALNLILRKWMPAQALKNGELLTLYVPISATALLMSYDMFLLLVSIVVHAFWRATPGNEWRQLFWHYLPDWLTVRDQDTLRAFYLGEQSIFDPLYLLPWLKAHLLVVGVYVCPRFCHAVHQRYHTETVG